MVKSSLMKLKYLLFPKSIRGKNNHILIKCKIKKGICIVRGNNNHIEIPSTCKFIDAKINILGDNNTLILKDNVRLLGPCTISMLGNATLILGENCGVRGVNFNIKDGKVSFGRLCMFSYGINIRNHDSHKVFFTNETLQMNQPKDIMVGDHVWIGQNVTILKGVNVGNDSVIGFGSVVTKGCGINCILAGNPAKIVKENINWDY